MSTTAIILICVFLAFTLTWIVYPVAFRFAKKHHIVDNPDARKLQRYPIPVLGGVAIAVGMTIPIAITTAYFDWGALIYIFVFMAIMLVIGVLDDLYNLSATLRFALELFIVGAYIYVSGSMIDSFHGLWGITTIPLCIGIPLSIIAGVGIINSINLIDGVDGYSSGFGIMACTIFSILFLQMGEYEFACFTLICAGSIIPFYCHNAFGQKTKMYIGDGGTLMLGTVMSCCIFHILSVNSPCSQLGQEGFGLVAFCLAVMCLPIFDTVRVMCRRLAHRISPFTPDRTHLHHLYLDLGFSHIGTAMMILLTNIFIILCWWLSFRLGMSINGQFYVVITLGLLATFVFYPWMRGCIRRRNGVYRIMTRIGHWSHFERKGLWHAAQQIVDGEWRKKETDGRTANS